MLRRTWAWVLLSGASALLTSCTHAQSAVDKINQAFPVPPETLEARNGLFASAQGDTAAEATLQNQWVQRLQLRALTCSTGVTIGRLDGIDEVRSKPVDKTCLAEQDTAVAEWIGIRRVAQLLALLPLRAKAPLDSPALLVGDRAPTRGVAIARDANVAVVARYRYTVHELPSGKHISQFNRPKNLPNDSVQTPSLSPNGRLAAIPSVRRLVVVDAASGGTLWDTENYRGVLAWLPEIDAVLLQPTATGTLPVVMDLRSGNTQPDASGNKGAQWSVQIPGKPATRLLLASGQLISLVQYTRNGAGVLESSVVSQWRLPGRGITSQPFVMQDGRKLVYSSKWDIAWFDLQTGENRTWPFSTAGTSGTMAKLDARRLMIDVRLSMRSARAPMILDLQDETLARVTGPEALLGHLLPLAEYEGFARQNHDATFGAPTYELWFGTAVESEAPRPLADVLAEVQKEIQAIELLNKPR
jgi:hypothetical protein